MLWPFAIIDFRVLYILVLKPFPWNRIPSRSSAKIYLFLYSITNAVKQNASWLFESFTRSKVVHPISFFLMDDKDKRDFARFEFKMTYAYCTTFVQYNIRTASCYMYVYRSEIMFYRLYKRWGFCWYQRAWVVNPVRIKIWYCLYFCVPMFMDGNTS